MQTVIMDDRCSLSEEKVIEAIKIAREKGGVREVRFIELSYAPDAQSLQDAERVSVMLLTGGFGVALRVDWAFAGTNRWAVQTENVRVANEGGEIRPQPSVPEPT